MTTLIAVAVIVSGWASQYSPGVMAEVLRNRTSGREGIVQMPPPLYRPIAVSECDRLGENIRLRYAGGPWEMATVVDCARSGDGSAEWMEENNILLEMDHRRAVELGTVGRGIRVEIITYEIREIEQGERLSGPHIVVKEGDWQ
jgi:hypothetical protein